MKEERNVFEKNKHIFKELIGYEKIYLEYKKYSKEVLKETSSKKWIDNFKNVGYKSERYIETLKTRKYESAYHKEELAGDMHVAMLAYKKFIS